MSCSHDCLCGCLFKKGCDGYKFTCPPLKCLFGKVSLARRYLVRAQCVVLGFLGLFGLVNFFNVQIASAKSHGYFGIIHLRVLWLKLNKIEINW